MIRCMASPRLAVSEHAVCDGCWDELDEIDLWISADDDHILCSKCEEEQQ